MHWGQWLERHILSQLHCDMTDICFRTSPCDFLFILLANHVPFMIVAADCQLMLKHVVMIVGVFTRLWYMPVSTCRFLPPLSALFCRLVPPCPPAAPQLRVAVFLQGIRCACGCQPSCCLFGVDVVVGHRAVLFVAGFESLPVQGRCCRNLDLTLLCSFYCRRGYYNVLDSSLCRTARWGIKDPSFRIMFVYHVT